MNKKELLVPQGIQYISEWEDYQLPRGEHCIVDKGVTGCGYTEFCLTNNDNVILCSPRKLLLENKRDQHIKDPNILYLENKVENFSDTRVLELRVLSHIQYCQSHGLATKIMVTYDSLYHITRYAETLRELKDFIYVVDEFQSIFLDSYFKAEVEVDFVNSLQDCQNVIYLSATPMLDKYLNRLPEFKDLTFYKLDWSQTGCVENVVISRRRVSSLGYECGKIIDRYLKEKFEYRENSEGNVIESTQAVFYFNSVQDITRVLSSKNLTPENTLVLCSDTPENRAKLNKMSRDLGYDVDNGFGFKVGKIPLKGEPYPMFMFCTASVYMGVDFYSPCARTFVFADPNIDSLSLDISLDIPQIAGRQRDRFNPFKNEINLFFKTISKDKILSFEEFDERQKERRKKSQHLLSMYEKANEDEKVTFMDKILDGIKQSKYSKDFISISKKDNTPVYNYLIDIANERAWDVSQADYQDQISVTRALRDQGYGEQKYLEKEERIVSEFLTTKFYTTGFFHEKMRMYCEFMDQHQEDREIISNILLFKIKDPSFRTYYDYYGTQGCKAKMFQKSNLDSGLKNASLEYQLVDRINNTFSPGNRYTMKEAKQRLSEIYSDLGITKTAKAKDLENYFTLVRTRITLPDKTVTNGFKIVGIK